MINIFKDETRRINFRLFAMLSQQFNSYFEIQKKENSLLTGKPEDFIFTGLFLPETMRRPDAHYNILYWNCTPQVMAKIEKETYYVETLGWKPERIYVPELFSEQKEALIKILGMPDGSAAGIMTASGRSLWIFDENPICLKFDTYQLRDNKPLFYEKYLSEAGIFQTQNIYYELQRQESENVFDESKGLSITFNSEFSAGNRLRLTYLVRTPGVFSDSENAILLPASVLLSVKFWENREILEVLGIVDKRFEILAGLARSIAQLIWNSLEKSAIHFELHQQNLSLMLTSEGAVPVYQDLMDTLFDPVSFLGQSLPGNPSQLEISLAETFDRIFLIQKFVQLNSQGELIKHDSVLRESMTVSCFYRRYISNFGHFNESFSVLRGDEQFMNRNFEQEVLAELNRLGGAGQILSEETELSGDLYWNIEQRVRAKHSVAAVRLWKLAIQAKCPEVSLAELIHKMNTSKVITSAGFPVHIDKIDKMNFGKIVEVLKNRIYIAEYEGRPTIILTMYYVLITSKPNGNQYERRLEA